MSLSAMYQRVFSVGCIKSNEGVRDLMYYSGTEMNAKILPDGRIHIRVFPLVQLSLDDLEAEAAQHAVEGSVVVDRSTKKTLTFQPLP